MPPTPDIHAAARSLDAGRIDCWIFDLDNTLYPAAIRLFYQVERRMIAFLQEKLDLELAHVASLKRAYYRAYGSSLRGFMEHHGVCPQEFLGSIYHIDLSPLAPDPALRAAIAALPGRKLIFTNASNFHVERILAARGLGGLFDHHYDIVAADYVPKPQAETYQRLIEQQQIEPVRAVFFEDSQRNLAPAAALGMTTVFIAADGEEAEQAKSQPHVHHVTEDLTDWLCALVGPSKNS